MASSTTSSSRSASSRMEPSQGSGVGRADPMLAATALRHGLELVTGNAAHFQRIQQIGYPLVLVNWRV